MINLYSDLDEISFIAGSRNILEFEIFDKDNKPVDLSIMVNISWRLSYLGDKDNPVLIKTGNVLTGNHFNIYLESEDTIDLRGKFIHQPILEDVSGHTYKPAEGLINIVESIKE